MNFTYKELKYGALNNCNISLKFVTVELESCRTSRTSLFSNPLTILNFHNYKMYKCPDAGSFHRMKHSELKT